VLQGWRKRSADAGHTSLKYQHADIVTGLAFEHYPVRESRQFDLTSRSMVVNLVCNTKERSRGT
jgi:hypothetical protein